MSGVCWRAGIQAAVVARAKPSHALGRGLDWIGAVVKCHGHKTRSKSGEQQRRALLARHIGATSPFSSSSSSRPRPRPRRLPPPALAPQPRDRPLPRPRARLIRCRPPPFPLRPRPSPRPRSCCLVVAPSLARPRPGPCPHRSNLLRCAQPRARTMSAGWGAQTGRWRKVGFA